MARIERINATKGSKENAPGITPEEVLAPFIFDLGIVWAEPTWMPGSDQKWNNDATFTAEDLKDINRAIRTFRDQGFPFILVANQWMSIGDRVSPHILETYFLSLFTNKLYNASTRGTDCAIMPVIFKGWYGLSYNEQKRLGADKGFDHPDCVDLKKAVEQSLMGEDLTASDRKFTLELEMAKDSAIGDLLKQRPVTITRTVPHTSVDASGFVYLP